MLNEEKQLLIEAFVAGSMSPNERQDFEREMRTDEALRKAVETHRLIVEAAQLTALQSERDRLKSIHKAAMASEEVFPMQEASRSKTLPIRRVLSWAALLLIGLLSGLAIGKLGGPTTQDSRPIADLPKDDDDLFGGMTDGIPFYESELTVRKLSTRNGQLDTASFDILLSISHTEDLNKTYELSEGSMQLYWSPEKLNLNADFGLILQYFDDPPIRQLLLRMDQQLLQIPISAEDFEKLWQR